MRLNFMPVATRDAGTGGTGGVEKILVQGGVTIAQVGLTNMPGASMPWSRPATPGMFGRHY